MRSFRVFILLLTIFSCCINAQNVDIPDTSFLYILIDEGVDINGDSFISYTEADAVTVLDISHSGITDMSGIEAFTNLDSLDCTYNLLTGLDVSSNSELRYLICYANQLTTLDVSNNTGLSVLDCHFNELTSLDVSNNTELAVLNCHFNELSVLDVSNNSELEQLWCFANQINQLDVSGCTGLKELWCYENDLAGLDASGCDILTELWCHYNRITGLDVTDNTELTGLLCCHNQLTSLDLSRNPALTKLYINSMPDLYQVDVRTMPFPPDDVKLDTTGSPNVYFVERYVDLEAPEIVSIDTLGRPFFIEVMSSENGVIFLVPENTGKESVKIREKCIADTAAAIADSAVKILLSDTISDGIYWIYAMDSAGNISEPEAFTIMNTGINNDFTDRIRIHPNPANDLLTIETHKAGTYFLELYSVNGHLMHSCETAGPVHQLDLSSFRKGAYLIVVRSKEYLKTETIIKQ